MFAAPLANEGTPATTRAGAAVRAAEDAENLDALERELDLNGEELSRFREKADAERSALAAWAASESGKDFAALAKSRAIAARAKNLETANKLWDQMRKLGAQRTELHREKRADVLESLTPGQQRRWAGYVLYARVAGHLDRVQLSTEQQAELRRIADAHAAPAVEPAKIREDPFFLRLTPLRSPVIAELRERVLTVEQNQQLRANRGPKALTTRPENAATLEKE